MIFQPPFYRPPYFYNPTYRRNYINNYEHKQPDIKETPSDNISSNKENDKVPSYETRSNNNNNEFIEIFGIKLFFDDILILCLLFFLYKQNVNDPLLFIALLLLLLS